jgi:hypothetical protein
VAKYLIPLNIITGDGVRQMVQMFIKIGAKYPNCTADHNLPTERTVANHIKSIYKCLKQKVINELLNVETIGITCDHWVMTSLKLII